MKKRVCELFAGVGGFRLGLLKSASDWDFVWANQWEPSRTKQHAFDCYCEQFGKTDIHVNKDIAQVDKSTIPDHELLVGGFPCQDYSVARSLSGNNGIEGKKGVLWWEIRDVLIKKEPPFVLLENVDRLLKSPASQRGRDFGIMLQCFKECGYDVEWRVINAAEYGGAQRRRRTFIFAYKKNTNYHKKVSTLSMRDVVTKDGFFASSFEIIESISENEIEFKYIDTIEVSEKFKFEFMNAGYMTGDSIFTAKVLPKEEEPVLLKDILEREVDERYYLGDKLEKWEYLKGSKKIERTSKTGHKYIFSEGAIAFPDDLDKPARTMLTSESSVNRSSHVVRDLDTGKLRTLTPVEAERINGFEDNWTNTGMPEKFRYFCMGNALVVPMITRMGNKLNKIFENEDSKK